MTNRMILFDHNARLNDFYQRCNLIKHNTFIVFGWITIRRVINRAVLMATIFVVLLQHALERRTSAHADDNARSKTRLSG